MCIINPYTEWTGYVANGGFFLAELLRNRREKGVGKIKAAFCVGAATAGAFALFCGHYLLNTEREVFFNTLKARFFARNIMANVPLKLLFMGYWESFGALLGLIGAFTLVLFYEKDIRKEIRKIKKEDKILFLVTVFPVFENVVMKEHAVAYTYDRMKLAFPLILLLYWLIYKEVDINNKKHRIGTAVFCLALLCIPAFRYGENGKYLWAIDYEEGNRALCRYINENYDDSVIGFSSAVRGYLNMSLGRGCYEFISDAGSLDGYAGERDIQYIVLLWPENVGGMDAWNKYCLSAAVYDRYNAKIRQLANNREDIIVSDWADMAGE